MGRIERAGKWIKRNPVVAGAAVAVVLALVTGTTVSYVKYREAEAALDKADDALSRRSEQRTAADEARDASLREQKAERWGRTERTSWRLRPPCRFRTSAPLAGPSTMLLRSIAIGNGVTSKANSTAPPSLSHSSWVCEMARLAHGPARRHLLLRP